jgi:hypothetical protein
LIDFRNKNFSNAAFMIDILENSTFVKIFQPTARVVTPTKGLIHLGISQFIKTTEYDDRKHRVHYKTMPNVSGSGGNNIL